MMIITNELRNLLYQIVLELNESKGQTEGNTQRKYIMKHV